MKKVLILGGGFGGVETFRQLHKYLHVTEKDPFSVELINETNYFTFWPMLHEVATGSVARDHVVQPLREILSCCGKDFHQATVQKILPKEKKVITNRREHSYDVLIIALGIKQGFFGVPGAQEHTLTLKSLNGAIDIRNRIIRSFERASEHSDRNNHEALRNALHFVIVGGGATGTELAGQLSDLLTSEMKKFYADVPNDTRKVTLIHAGPRLLEQLSEEAGKRARSHLLALDVDVMLNSQVVEVTKDAVVLKDGQKLYSDNIFWTAGTESGLKDMIPAELLTERGLVNVLPTFQTVTHPEIFALGDSATVNDDAYKYPPLAQAAVQAARVVAPNVVAYVQNMPATSLTVRKYRHKGDIIPIGDWWGIFERKNILVSGKLAWWLRRTVFLQSMYSMAKRLQVLVSWTLRIFLPRDISEF